MLSSDASTTITSSPDDLGTTRIQTVLTMINSPASTKVSLTISMLPRDPNKGVFLTTLTLRYALLKARLVAPLGGLQGLPYSSLTEALALRLSELVQGHERSQC